MTASNQFDRDKIDRFFRSAAFGVAGASADRSKFGNKVLRVYQQKGFRAVPINPRETEIEGIKCVPDVSTLPDEVTSISIITPPPVTEKIVATAIARGVQNIWIQPGAESQRAVEMCDEAGINVIAGGTCILVVLGYRGE